MRAIVSCLFLLSLSASAARLTVRIDHSWNGAPFGAGMVPGSMGETHVSVMRLCYLLSQIQLRRESGEWIRAGDWVEFVDPMADRTRFTLDGIPDGSYDAIRFDLGLDPATDASDPARRPPGHPLHPDVNGLHWSWRGGYVFLAAEGLWEQSKETSGGWSYHLAGEDYRGTVEVAVRFDLAEPKELVLAFDAARLFDAVYPIDPAATAVTHSLNDDGLASRITDNALRAFSLVGVGPGSRSEPPVPRNASAVSPPAVLESRIPAHFPAAAWPADHPPTAAGMALGERLFRDPLLSVNGLQSCSTCHQDARALSDARRFSIGAEGRAGRRNAMPLFNLAWKPSFFWDGRSPSLREQVLHPIRDPDEMNESPDRVVEKLKNAPGYADAFASAFGDAGISLGTLAIALEQFLLTRISGDARIDKALADFSQLTESEARGFVLFFSESDPGRGMRGADCFHCHGGAHFTNHQFANNGLDADEDRADQGRFTATGKTWDRGRFMVPSLRNVALTAPYMHDGRFATIEEVIVHYNSELKPSATLDPNLARHRAQGGLGLSERDQADLAAFLRSLTGESATRGGP